MPVRSLNSAVLKWPDAETVISALQRWAAQVVSQRSDVQRIGYYGSYARGDWGVGSDLDLIIIVEGADLPFEQRGIEWDTTALPVPADTLIYTNDEFQNLRQQGRFFEVLEREAIWFYSKGESALPSGY